MDKRYTIAKPEHGSQDWLRVRWKNEQGLARISASVAAAVHNCHNYMTKADLATELLCATPPEPKEANAAMERGNRLEPLLIQWAAELNGKTLITPDRMYCFDSEDDKIRLIATLDAIDPMTNVPWEVKTTSKMWDGTLNSMWYWQGVQQAICADSDRVEWVIFDSRLELHTYTQFVSSDEKQAHISACRALLKDIDMDEVPEDVFLTMEHASQLNPVAHKNKGIDLIPEAEILFEQLNKIKPMIQALEVQESELKAQIAMYMGDAEEASLNGKKVVTWKNVNRETFDTKRFESEHPALASKYRKMTSYRTMRINY